MRYTARMSDDIVIPPIDKSKLLRGERGRFVTGTAKHTITVADASKLAKKRAEMYRQAAVRRITGEIAAIDPTVSTGADAFSVIAAKQAVALLDSEKPRVDDLVRLRDLMTGKDAREDTQAQAAGVIADVAHDMAAMSALWADVLARQAGRKSADVVDAVAHDADS